MANIIRQLKTSIEAATGLPFVYGGNQEVNVLLENAPLPCAMAFLVDSSQIIAEAGALRERINIAVFFIDKTDFDCDSVENEDIIGTMKRQAFVWLQKALQRTQADGIKVGEVTNAQRIYDQFDTIVTGYGITVPIEELQGVTQCDTYEEAEE